MISGGSMDGNMHHFLILPPKNLRDRGTLNVFVWKRILNTSGILEADGLKMLRNLTRQWPSR